MIEITKLKKYYGIEPNLIPAADNISLEVSNGEFVMITGPSGSGKTTLLNLIGGMTNPDSGEITVNNRKISEMSDSQLSKFRANTIGFIFQFQSMIPTLNVMHNVMLPTIYSDKKADIVKAESLLEKVGLLDRFNAYSYELSVGQQRRVCIARAFINNPSVLLCDEPTSDLDSENKEIIMNMINSANKTGTTVFFVTHNRDMSSYANSFYTIHAGCINKE